MQKMTDNTDLLGGDAPPAAPAPRRRGRPAKPKAVIVVADPARPDGDASVTTVAEVQSNGDLKILDEVLASTNDGNDSVAAAPAPEGSLDAFLQGIDPEIAKRLAPDPVEDTSKFDEIQSVPNEDGSVSVELPPLSADYTLALAHRIKVFGEQKRTYAYQRVLRAGKKL
jgi:hypothetical protein